MKKLIFFWKELLSTFWFVPSLIIIVAMLLSFGLVALDGIVNLSKEGDMRFFIVNSPDSARTILSTISGAMMGVAGTVFSITLVALTLASSQFGPRLIKNFMYVRLNQVVLGTYIATFLYCLLVLNAIKDSGEIVFIPSLSILAAIVAAILNILLLIVFIHQIAVSIQADHIIADISKFISKQLKTLFPESIGDEVESQDGIDSAEIISSYKYQSVIKSPKSGYLQYIDSDSLTETLAEKDLLLELYHRPGSHVVKNMEFGVLYAKSKCEDEEEEKIMNQFVIGNAKTSQQDIEYSIHQMVEIAARALSPGINDPFTAIACIDNLTSTMCYLAQVKFPSKYRLDKNDNLRVIADIVNFEGALDASFNQIRQFSSGSTAVVIRLMEALAIIYGFAKQKSQQKAVLKHVDMVLRLGKETIQEKNDLKDLKERAEKLKNT